MAEVPKEPPASPREAETTDDPNRSTSPSGRSDRTKPPPAPREFYDARYDVRALLGEGGMASVHVAFDPILLRDVALKRLAASRRDDADVQRFVVEAQITGQLDHPNIVPLHDLVLDANEPYFVMKVLGGKTFGQLMAETRAPRHPDALDELLGVLVKVCDAVAFAHSRGVVHRDLKPSNVMVDTFGRVYVMDWGLARVLPEGATAQVMTTRTFDDPDDDGSGTIAYMAPEQALPGWRAIGVWTDVYALGAILYEIITGTLVHVAGSNDALRALAYHGEIEPPASRVPGGAVPAALSRIALKATAREPEERYARVEDFAREIEMYRRGGVRLPVASFEPGARVVVEGDAGTTAYVIERGRCVAYKTIDGERVVLREMGPGDVFGEMAVISAQPRTATVEAVEPLVVRVIERELLAEGLSLDTWMGAFVRALVERFREAEDKLARARGG